MLQLQQLALRRDLQIIVTSHSPVVLDSVPPHGRVFLDRDVEGRVVVHPPYRDLVQDALYGRAGEVVNLLCEDDTAESVLQGVFDSLLPRRMIRRESVRIGRDTGASEFSTHAAAFRKFGQIRNVVFVLDGDARNRSFEEKIRKSAGTDVPVLFLPGPDAPEAWVWSVLPRLLDGGAQEFGAEPVELMQWIERIDTIYASAAGTASEIAKGKLYDLSEKLGREIGDVCRVVGRLEAERDDSDIQPLVEALEEALQSWRSG